MPQAAIAAAVGLALPGAGRAAGAAGELGDGGRTAAAVDRRARGHRGDQGNDASDGRRGDRAAIGRRASSYWRRPTFGGDRLEDALKGPDLGPFFSSPHEAISAAAASDQLGASVDERRSPSTALTIRGLGCQTAVAGGWRCGQAASPSIGDQLAA